MCEAPPPLRTRKCNGHRRADTERALRAEVSSHVAGERATDRESQPDTITRVSSLGIDLHERLEYRLEFGQLYSDSGVFDRHEGVRRRRLPLGCNFAAV